MESNNTTKYLIGALVVTAIIIGYFYFGGGGSTSAVNSGVVPVTATKTTVAQGDPVFLQALLGLRNADMNKDIFNNQILINLKDFSRELVDEPKGRVNPFAPFDKELQSTANFTQTNTQANNPVAPSKTIGD